jgi:predicted house-cleaning noncanonical NTP pyrophosphatase (MazG superfamily)
MPKKLIRDKIPEIIKKQGRNPDFYVADENEYKDELFKKLLEETNEVLEEKMNKEKLIEEL